MYLAKFKQCLSKAMHFMKAHIINTMQNLTSQLMKRVSKSQRSIPHVHFLCCFSPVTVFLCPTQDPMNLTNADNAFTLYYVKYRAAAPKVRVSTGILFFFFLHTYTDNRNDTLILFAFSH